MEATNTNANNSEFQDDISDNQIEKAVQDFNEFSEKVAESSGAMELEDLMDLYINNRGESSWNKPQTAWDSETAFEDFNNFKSTQISQEQSEHVQRIHGIDTDRQIQESKRIIHEMMEYTSPNDTGRFPKSSQTVNINSDVEVVNSSIRVTHIRYGDLNCHEAADAIISNVFGGCIETMFASVKKENARRTTRRKVKRKYGGVTETEEEIARRMETIKTQTREAAAKAHVYREANEA